MGKVKLSKANFIIVALLVIFFSGIQRSSFARDGEMNILLKGGAMEGSMDLGRLASGQSYGISYSYWLNDTSTIDLGLNYLMSKFSVKMVKEDDEFSEDLDYSTFFLTVGISYIPELDFFLRPSIGFGLGYQFWKISSDKLEDRAGETPCYYALFSFDYPVTDKIFIGAFVEPVYFPFRERLEKEAMTNERGQWVVVEKDKLEEGLVWTGGFLINFRIY